MTKTGATSAGLIYASTYTSAGWDHPTDVTDSLGPVGAAGSSPVAVLDGAGEAVVVWRQSDGNDVALHAIQGSGSSWSAPVRLSPPGTDVVGSAGREVDVSLIADDHGNVIVAWAQEDLTTDCGGNPCSQIFLSEYRRGAWHHPEAPSDHVSPVGQMAFAPDLATDDDGNALLAWSQNDGLPGCTEGSCAQTFLSEYR